MLWKLDFEGMLHRLGGKCIGAKRELFWTEIWST